MATPEDFEKAMTKKVEAYYVDSPTRPDEWRTIVALCADAAAEALRPEVSI